LGVLKKKKGFKIITQMKVYFRYFLKEYFTYTGIFFAVFSLLISLVMGILKLQKFINLNPTGGDILRFFFYMYLELVSFCLPLAGFMGSLFCIHRLKEDREILALYTLGFSFRDLLKPVFVFSLLLFLITFFFHFYVLPFSKRSVKLMKFNLFRQGLLKAFPSKRPLTLASHYVLYVKKDEENSGIHEFEKVLLFDKLSNKTYIFVSKRGKLSVFKKRFLLLNGWGFSLAKDGKVEVMKFKEYGFFLPIGNLEKTPSFSKGELLSSELLKKIKNLRRGTAEYYAYLTEYLNRYFFPLSVFFLVFQGFIIAMWLNTSHRFALFSIGVGIYLSYYILFNLFQSLAKTGKLEPLLSFSLFYLLIGLTLVLEFCFYRLKGVKGSL